MRHPKFDERIKSSKSLTYITSCISFIQKKDECISKNFWRNIFEYWIFISHWRVNHIQFKKIWFLFFLSNNEVLMGNFEVPMRHTNWSMKFNNWFKFNKCTLNEYQPHSHSKEINKTSFFFVDLFSIIIYNYNPQLTI